MAVQEVVLEVVRAGRRSRYHLAARTKAGDILTPEQCNIDQIALGWRTHDKLPPVRRPRTQLCRRCFRGHPLLEG